MSLLAPKLQEVGAISGIAAAVLAVIALAIGLWYRWRDTRPRLVFEMGPWRLPDGNTTFRLVVRNKNRASVKIDRFLLVFAFPGRKDMEAEIPPHRESPNLPYALGGRDSTPPFHCDLAWILRRMALRNLEPVTYVIPTVEDGLGHRHCGKPHHIIKGDHPECEGSRFAKNPLSWRLRVRVWLLERKLKRWGIFGG
jgi:hypothetical protein